MRSRPAREPALSASVNVTGVTLVPDPQADWCQRPHPVFFEVARVQRPRGPTLPARSRQMSKIAREPETD
jgi:hypothetical protein